jgi:hypothetical protein
MLFPYAASVLHFHHDDGRQREHRNSSMAEDSMRHDRREFLD